MYLMLKLYRLKPDFIMQFKINKTICEFRAVQFLLDHKASPGTMRILWFCVYDLNLYYLDVHKTL